MKYFFGFLASIGLIAIVVILVMRGFSGGNKPADRLVLADYAGTDMAVQLTADGPITADETHRGYHILIDRLGSKIETYKGYENTVLEAKTYDGNETAYANFLSALDLLNYTKGNTDPSKNDERGICPAGQRYIYEVLGSPKGDLRFWSTSCGGGTFGGNAAQTRTLFQAQIPDFTLLTGPLELY